MEQLEQPVRLCQRLDADTSVMVEYNFLFKSSSKIGESGNGLRLWGAVQTRHESLKHVLIPPIIHHDNLHETRPHPLH
jgi:hypothetical protein